MCHSNPYPLIKCTCPLIKDDKLINLNLLKKTWFIVMFSYFIKNLVNLGSGKKQPNCCNKFLKNFFIQKVFIHVIVVKILMINLLQQKITRPLFNSNFRPNFFINVEF